MYDHLRNETHQTFLAWDESLDLCLPLLRGLPYVTWEDKNKLWAEAEVCVYVIDDINHSNATDM